MDIRLWEPRNGMWRFERNCVLQGLTLLGSVAKLEEVCLVGVGFSSFFLKFPLVGQSVDSLFLQDIAHWALAPLLPVHSHDPLHYHSGLNL